LDSEDSLGSLDSSECAEDDAECRGGGLSPSEDEVLSTDDTIGEEDS